VIVLFLVTVKNKFRVDPQTFSPQNMVITWNRSPAAKMFQFFLDFSRTKSAVNWHFHSDFLSQPYSVSVFTCGNLAVSDLPLRPSGRPHGAHCIALYVQMGVVYRIILSATALCFRMVRVYYFSSSEWDWRFHNFPASVYASCTKSRHRGYALWAIIGLRRFIRIGLSKIHVPPSYFLKNIQ